MQVIALLVRAELAARELVSCSYASETLLTMQESVSRFDFCAACLRVFALACVVEFDGCPGSRARVGFGERSKTKSRRRRAQKPVAASDEADAAWSSECWDARSSVDVALPQCNCFGPMKNGARTLA